MINTCQIINEKVPKKIDSTHIVSFLATHNYAKDGTKDQ